MTTYRELLESQPHHAVHKWSHYPEIYDEVFEPYRGASSVLEIGVQNGGSLQLLARIFSRAQVYGLDIDPTCAKLNGMVDDRIKVVIGDAASLSVLAALPNFDVIIDDGSHVPQLQAVAFAFLFQHKLTSNGAYLVEDLDNSYYRTWPPEPWFALGNFFDFVRSRVDDMHSAYFNKQEAMQSPYALQIRKIAIYHGIAVFYKSSPLDPPKDQWWEGKRIV